MGSINLTCDSCNCSECKVIDFEEGKYCTSCMTSKPELFTFRAVLIIYFDEVDEFGEPEFITIYLKNIEDAKQAKEDILESSIGKMVDDVDALSMEEAFELSQKDKIHPFHPLTRFRMDSNWDSHTFYYLINDDIQEEISEILVEDLLESEAYESVTSLSKLEDAIQAVHPHLKKYHLLYDLEEKAKRHLRKEDREKLSQRSQKMMGDFTRKNKGLDFENRFREYCEERGLEFIKTQVDYATQHENVTGQKIQSDKGNSKEDILNSEVSNQFSELHEKIMDSIGEKKGVLEKVTGLPDFIVWDGIEEINEIPYESGPIFVEVKYNTSKLTERQKYVFPKLEELGFDIAVFTEKENNYSISKYEEF